MNTEHKTETDVFLGTNKMLLITETVATTDKPFLKQHSPVIHSPIGRQIDVILQETVPEVIVVRRNMLLANKSL